MLLYPRLTLSVAMQIAKQKSSIDPIVLRQTHSNNEFVVHKSALYAPTGGSKVSIDKLKEVRELVRKCANELGFPELPNLQSRNLFDQKCGILLLENMLVSPSEASSLGVWSHLTCVLLPDIVRWRFAGDTTAEERFIGSARGVRRNTFGRLWWRAFLLYEESYEEDPYFLLGQFGEDDLVQITERPSLAGHPRLAKQILLSFLDLKLNQHLQGDFTEREILRDVVKRVRRLLSLVMFEALDSDTLKLTVDDLFSKSASSFAKR